MADTRTAEPRKLRIFLCHASDDKPRVRVLYQKLWNNGFQPWLDERHLLAGQEWETVIRKEVRESDVVLVCLSQASITKKGFVQKEIKFALDAADEQPEGTIFIIPGKLEDLHISPCWRDDRLLLLSNQTEYHGLLLLPQRPAQQHLHSRRATTKFHRHQTPRLESTNWWIL